MHGAGTGIQAQAACLLLSCLLLYEKRPQEWAFLT